jgi:hypothetical protein
MLAAARQTQANGKWNRRGRCSVWEHRSRDGGARCDKGAASTRAPSVGPATNTTELIIGEIMFNLRTTSAVAVLFASLAFVPTPGKAQLNFEARGGTSIPAGDLADLTDVGGSAGASIGYWIHPRLNLRLDGDVGILPSQRAALPDLRLWNYGAGLEASVLSPASRLTLLARVGAGATTLDTDDFGGRDLTLTYFALNGGLTVGYDATRSINLFATGQAYVAFGDEDELRALSSLAPELNGRGVDQLWSIPVQAGIRVTLPGRAGRVASK